MSENLSSPGSIPVPAPRKSGSRLTIGIAAGALVLCLALIAIAAGVYFERDKIPALSGLFPTPTPEGVYYNSATLNFSLYYPPNWAYEEQSGTVAFATSQQVMDATTYTSLGALIVLTRDPSFVPLLTPDTDLTSPEAILGQIVGPKDPLMIIGGVGTELEPLRSFSVGGSPSASEVFSYDPDPNTHLLRYIMVIVPQGTPIIIFALCPQSEWATYRPTLDAMVASLDIRPMP